jgi:hypothetical protein
MIHIIETHQDGANCPLLETMFVDRKRLFVDLFGWDVPVVDGRFEIDQFDTPDTVYIIVADEDGLHEASIRLMPTTQPHMLQVVFSHLCPMGVPVGLGKSMIYRLIQEGKFPAPYKLSPFASRWSDREIVAWIDEVKDGLEGKKRKL